MGRRTTLVTIGYVALGSACSYALLALLPDGDYSLHERGGGWLLAYVCIGAVASVLFGAAVRHGWALAAPALIVVSAIPAGDVVEYLPLWAPLLFCAPFASVAIGFGSAIARFAERPTAVDAIWCAVAALLLAYGAAWVASVAAGHNPWEDPQGPDPAVFTSAVVTTLGGVGALIAATAARHRRA